MMECFHYSISLSLLQLLPRRHIKPPHAMGSDQPLAHAVRDCPHRQHRSPVSALPGLNKLLQASLPFSSFSSPSPPTDIAQKLPVPELGNTRNPIPSSDLLSSSAGLCVMSPAHSHRAEAAQCPQTPSSSSPDAFIAQPCPRCSCSSSLSKAKGWDVTWSPRHGGSQPPNPSPWSHFPGWVSSSGSLGCSQKVQPCSRLYEISSRGSGTRPQGHSPFLPASWQLPASFLHKGPIGNIELGEPQDSPSRDNLLSHHRSSSRLNLPWQGSPVHTLPITPASLAREEQINLHWYQIGFVQVTWLHLFARFGGVCVHEPGWAQGPVTLQCMRRRRQQQPNWRAGACSSYPGISQKLLSSSCAPKCCVFRYSPSPWASDGGCGAGMGLEIALWSHRMLL